MPMIPEDIITALTTLSASENMNDRQRVIMTEAAASIKHQQLLVMYAELEKKKSEARMLEMEISNNELRERVARVVALNDYWRQQLGVLGALSAMPEVG